MSKIISFRRHRKSHVCRGCGLPLNRAPRHWRLCKQCYTYNQFRRVLDEFREVHR